LFIAPRFFLLFSFKEEGKKKLVGKSCIVMDKIKELSFYSCALPLFFGYCSIYVAKALTLRCKRIDITP